MCRATRVLGLGILCVGSIFGWSHAASEDDVPSRLLKRDTWLYFEVREPRAIVDRWESDWVRSLFQTPDLAKAWESPQLKQMREVVEFVSLKLGMTSTESVRKLFGGGLVLAIEPGGEPGFHAYAIVTAGEPEYLDRFHAALVELARADAAAKGNPDPVSEFQHGGVGCFSVSSEEAHAIAGGRLWIANGRKALKSLLDRRQQPPAESLESDARFQAAHRTRGAQSTVWAFGRLGPLRELQAAQERKEGKESKPADPNTVILLGPWLAALERSPLGVAALRWTEKRLDLQVELDWPDGAVSERFKGFVPPRASRAPQLLLPKRGIASFGLWRDWSNIWENRAQLLSPEAVQNLAQLDTTAGTFFGGRDFGSGVLGAIGPNWRVVVAHQDYQRLDPQPDLKLPGFAIVFEVDPADEEFTLRLQAAFQSFIGLANLDAAQKKAPPLLLSSVDVEGVRIATARYVRSSGKSQTGTRESVDAAPIPDQFNFTPSAALVDRTFVLSTSLDLARDLVHAIRSQSAVNEDSEARGPTLVGELRGESLAQLVVLNRERLVGQNMLEKGNDRTTAEAAIASLERLLSLVEQGRLEVTDRADAMEVQFQVQLHPGKP